jgi:membrane protein required for colicin V production
MQGVDYILFAVLLLSIVIGTIRGLVREVVALATWLLAVIVAWRFSGFLHPYLGGILETPLEKAWVARAIVFVVVLLIGALAGHVLAWITHTAGGQSVVDRIFGFLFGLVRGLVICGFGALLGLHLRLDGEPWWRQSHYVGYAVHVAGWLESMGGESRELARRALAEPDTDTHF